MSSPALLIIIAQIADIHAVSVNAVSSHERGGTACSGCETTCVQDPTGPVFRQIYGSEEVHLDGAGMSSGSLPSLREAGCELAASEQWGLCSLFQAGRCGCLYLKYWGLQLSLGITSTYTGISSLLSHHLPAHAGSCPGVCRRWGAIPTSSRLHGSPRFTP